MFADAAAALLELLAGPAAFTQAGSAKPATATPTTGKTDKRLLDVKQVAITKGARVEILVQDKGKKPLAVATATVDSVDIAGKVILDPAAKTKVGIEQVVFVGGYSHMTCVIWAAETHDCNICTVHRVQLDCKNTLTGSSFSCHRSHMVLVAGSLTKNSVRNVCT